MSGQEALGVSYRAELCRHLLYLLDQDAIPVGQLPHKLTYLDYREKLTAVSESNGLNLQEPCTSRNVLIESLYLALRALPEERHAVVLYDGRSTRARRLIEWWEHRQLLDEEASTEQRRQKAAQTEAVAARRALDALKAKGHALLAAMDPKDREALRAVRHEI